MTTRIFPLSFSTAEEGKDENGRKNINLFKYVIKTGMRICILDTP
jgi:hypothetical protein